MVSLATQERIIIEGVSPQLDGGAFPVKRVEGDAVDIEADIFLDGHDALRAVVAYRAAVEENYTEIPMRELGNDRFHAQLPPLKKGRYYFTIKAWPDHFTSWQNDTRKKNDAGQDISLELKEIEWWLQEHHLNEKLSKKKKTSKSPVPSSDLLLSDEYARTIANLAPRDGMTTYARELEILVERKAAEFSAWYELFPRNETTGKDKSGTFADVEKRLPAIKAMGFDVLYFPPIHPIGKSFRKGKNNALKAGENDPGSPYAIGAKDGGHKAVHPALGSLEDFTHLVNAARKLDMEVALDFAVQCSPDHPYIKDHPEWFAFRPDGTIKHAENPPKKYQDIVNFNFSGPDAGGLWEELRSIVEFWIERGVTIFRVDNPHTKPFAFWQWLMETVHADYPDVLFLAEAFTRPKIMYRLSKIGFAQSYSYFTWRNTKQELTDYLSELTAGKPSEYFRPNFFPTTPDIFPPYLHQSGRAGFMIRLALAATLGSNYGMLAGYELCEGIPIPDKEEYADSEKYEIKPRDWNAEGNIIPFVTQLNTLRHENAALQQFKNLMFCPAYNDHILFYCKWDHARHNSVFVAVNLDYEHTQEAIIELPLDFLNISPVAEYSLDDLLLGHSWKWTGKQQHLRLDPQKNPIAIFRITP